MHMVQAGNLTEMINPLLLPNSDTTEKEMPPESYCPLSSSEWVARASAATQNAWGQALGVEVPNFQLGMMQKQ
jgi:hypothetical protein